MLEVSQRVKLTYELSDIYADSPYTGYSVGYYISQVRLLYKGTV